MNETSRVLTGKGIMIKGLPLKKCVQEDDNFYHFVRCKDNKFAFVLIAQKELHNSIYSLHPSSVYAPNNRCQCNKFASLFGRVCPFMMPQRFKQILAVVALRDQVGNIVVSKQKLRTTKDTTIPFTKDYLSSNKRLLRTVMIEKGCQLSLCIWKLCGHRRSFQFGYS